MRPPELRLFADEKIVDLFAGGGGASTGIFMATGREPDVAVNHDREALAMYAANHSQTRLFCEDIFDVHPLAALGCPAARLKVSGGPRRKLTCRCKQPHKVGLAWFSPDCTFHSKARGKKPFRDRNRARRRRGLAGVVTRWAAVVRPRVLFVENVEEFQDWGPLIRNQDGEWIPDPARKGQSFRRWVSRLRNLGYSVDWRELRACDFGAPTSRKRLFIVATLDETIAWPEPTHGPGRAEPYRTAAECIDWSIPCPSIFDRKKPLAENTMKRIARGIRKYVLEAKQPFLVPVADPAQVVAPLLAPVKSWGGGGNDAAPADRPLRTVTASKRGEHAVVAPVMVRTDMHQSNAGCAYPPEDPLRTITSGGGHGIVAPVLAPVIARIGQTGGGGSYTKGADDPLSTVTGKAEHLLVAASLINTRNGEREGQAPRVRDIQEPMPTVTAIGSQGALVAAFLAKHFGGNYEGPGAPAQLPLPTVTATDHHAVMTSHLLKLRGGLDAHPNTSQSLEEPAPTLTAGGTHLAEVRAFLISYYGTDQSPQLDLPSPTLTTKHRLGLVTICGVDYQIVDICMRMLQPHELFAAQGFPPDYVIDPVVGKTAKGKPKRLTKTAQVHKCGNSVPPAFSAALVRAQFAPRSEEAVG